MFGRITKAAVGRKLVSVMGGQRFNREGKVGRTYLFDEQRLGRLMRRYKLRIDDLRQLVK